MQPPAQELVARDLHNHAWTFRHIYRGQPKRHLLTTGWGVFVSAKRLFAGDSVLFIRDEKSQLLLGIRRANRQQATMSSSVLSSDSMHIGVLAVAAHVASNHSPFAVFYNPRASPSEFVIPLSKYNKAIYGTQVSLGMRFRMMFETEESGVRRYMGTITGISDLDSMKWPNSQWRNIQVGWDESTAGERQNRVSIWEIEPVATPFFICPPPFFRTKRPRQPGMLGEESEIESAIKRSSLWFGEETGIVNSQNPTMPGVGLLQWMNMHQRPDIINSAIQPDYYRPMAAATLQKLGSSDITKPLNSAQQALQSHQLQFSIPQSQQSELYQPQIKWPQQQHHLSNQQQQQQVPSQQLDQHHLHMQQQNPSQQVEQQHSSRRRHPQPRRPKQ